MGGPMFASSHKCEEVIRCDILRTTFFFYFFFLYWLTFKVSVGLGMFFRTTHSTAHHILIHSVRFVFDCGKSNIAQLTDESHFLYCLLNQLIRGTSFFTIINTPPSSIDDMRDIQTNSSMIKVNLVF